MERFALEMLVLSTSMSDIHTEAGWKCVTMTLITQCVMRDGRLKILSLCATIWATMLHTIVSD